MIKRKSRMRQYPREQMFKCQCDREKVTLTFFGKNDNDQQRCMAQASAEDGRYIEGKPFAVMGE